MKKRIEIETAENGYVITVCEKSEEYREPEKMVARDDQEVLDIVKECLADQDD